jgi:hypothetical protein
LAILSRNFSTIGLLELQIELIMWEG